MIVFQEHPSRRSPRHCLPYRATVFLQTLAVELDGAGELGDGTVHRAAIKAQREVMRMRVAS